MESGVAGARSARVVVRLAAFRRWSTFGRGVSGPAVGDGSAREYVQVWLWAFSAGAIHQSAVCVERRG